VSLAIKRGIAVQAVVTSKHKRIPGGERKVGTKQWICLPHSCVVIDCAAYQWQIKLHKLFANPIQNDLRTSNNRKFFMR